MWKVMLVLLTVLGSAFAASTASFAAGFTIQGNKLFFPDGTFFATAPTDGKSVLNGSGSPIMVGKIGDFYIDTTNHLLYGPYSGVWGTGISLNGAIGAAGATGTTGATGPIGITGMTGAQGLIGLTGASGPQGTAGVGGNTVLNGAGTPVNTGAIGTIGDFYLDTSADLIYGPKVGTEWTGIVGVALVGPTGATGTKGPIGATGATGTSGTQGPTGATGAVGAAGATGSTGATGPIGTTGATGAQGTAGAIGATGATGATLNIPATNLLSGTDFATGSLPTGWVQSGATLAVSPPYVKVLSIGGGYRLFYSNTGVTPNISDVLYFCIRGSVDYSTSTSLQAFIKGTTGTMATTAIPNPVSGTEYLISAYKTWTGMTGPVVVGIIDNSSQVGVTLSVRSPVLLNLTSIFGAGNEPRQTDMDVLMAALPNGIATSGNLYTPLAPLLDVWKLKLRPVNGAQISLDDSGFLTATSASAAGWAGFSPASTNTTSQLRSAVTGLNGESFGLDSASPGALPLIPHTFSGPIRTDSFISVLAGPHGRWHSDYGSHLFEGWNTRRTYRLSMAIGLNPTVDKEDVASIFSYSSTNLLAYPGSAAFGRTQLGTDELDASGNLKGTIFTRDGCTVNGSFEVKSNSIQIDAAKTPYASAAPCTTGQISWDANYVYVCVAPNTWKRSALSSW